MGALTLEAIEDVFANAPAIIKGIEDLFAMFGGSATPAQKAITAVQVIAAGTASVQASIASQPASATHLDSVVNSIVAAAGSTDAIAQAKVAAQAQAQSAGSGS